MLPLVLLGIAAWETLDYVGERIHKANVRNAVDAYVRETPLAPGESARIQSGNGLVVVTRLRTDGAAQRYYVENHDGRDKRSYNYDTGTGKLTQPSPTQEFGWKW